MLIAQRPTLSEEVVSDFRSRFVIEPLEPGFGYTLGNSLRRTLLSSIPGAAVTSIKIEGNQHEFSTLEGVVEDVTEIILNIKGLVVSSEEDEPVVMYLRKQGAGPITAADIELERYHVFVSVRAPPAVPVHGHGRAAPHGPRPRRTEPPVLPAERHRRGHRAVELPLRHCDGHGFGRNRHRQPGGVVHEGNAKSADVRLFGNCGADPAGVQFAAVL